MLDVRLRVLRDPGEAQELVQEVFLKVYRKARLFDLAKGKLPRLGNADRLAPGLREGCTLREIAERLNESLANVRHYYYRALEKLKANVISPRGNQHGGI